MSDASETVLEVGQAEVGPLALEMSLLVVGMTDGLSVRGPGGMSVELALGDADDTPHTQMRRSDPDQLTCVLSRRDAESLEAVLLRAYRDGMAETDHLHLEGKLEKQPYDLTVVFAVSRPAMSQEEAEKLLAD